MPLTTSYQASISVILFSTTDYDKQKKLLSNNTSIQSKATQIGIYPRNLAYMPIFHKIPTRFSLNAQKKQCSRKNIAFYATLIQMTLFFCSANCMNHISLFIYHEQL